YLPGWLHSGGAQSGTTPGKTLVRMSRTADIVICGAGITGVAAAHFLSKAGVRNILLLDERPPLSFTSDRSTECYRNLWPDAEMLALMNRSIDLMETFAEESGNVFRMNRRGYLYVTADEDKIVEMESAARATSSLGAGPTRVHSSAASSYEPAPVEGFHDQPTGADLLIGNELIRKYFPYLTQRAVAALHVRRAGWLSAQQLGMYLLETARTRGVRFESGRVTHVDVANGRVNGIRLSSGERVDSPIFINAAGPYLKEVGKLLGVDLPIHTELHLKAAIKDPLGVIGREAPLLIWTDPQLLPWEKEERLALAEDDETRWLTELLPAGAHVRPEGSGESQNILMLWDYKTRIMDPAWSPQLDEQYPEVALRGLTALLPRMQEYFERMPRPQLDGGYYTRTRENRPLVGPLGVDGAYVTGAVSGYGIMSACGVGELLAAHVTGTELPSYAKAFTLSRYDDLDYTNSLENWSDTGQL
ncbi:MAG TPA: FAD-binding oxidoreductase, partial [Anaerolineales bacterium]|nr:FAD-binding oxidoreductase [Anaerolineales bacterium]